VVGAAAVVVTPGAVVVVEVLVALDVPGVVSVVGSTELVEEHAATVMPTRATATTPGFFRT
jgi:hypothetical protein